MTNDSMTDKDLVFQILKGNERALRYFYHTFEPKLKRYIKGKIANEHDLEEVMQDVFLASLEAMRDFSFRCSLYTFIYSITKHKVIDYYRRKKIKNIVFSKIPDIEPLVATLFGPENQLDEQMLKQKISLAFQDITPRYRELIKLKYIYGFSVLEIARKLSISFKSAESQLFRARKAFILAYEQ